MTPDMLEPMEPPGGPMEADLNTPPPPPVARSHPYPAAPSGPPLPRSRPSEFATHEAKPPRTEKPIETPAIKSAPAPGAATVTPAAPPAVPATAGGHAAGTAFASHRGRAGKKAAAVFAADPGLIVGVVPRF